MQMDKANINILLVLYGLGRSPFRQFLVLHNIDEFDHE